MEAIQEAVGHTGNAVLTGAITTAAAFYTMCFNDFSGLAELGIISGTGILLCVVSTLFVFPAFLTILDRNRKNLSQTTAPNHWRAGFLLKQPFAQHPGLVVGSTVILIGLAIFYAFRVSFDYNLLNLQNPKLESVRVEHELLASQANSVIFAVSTATNLTEARQKADQFKALPTVLNVMTLTEVLPTQQEEKLTVARRIVTRLKQLNLDTDISDKVDVVRAQHELSQLLQQSREAENQARKYTLLSKRARDAQATFAKLIPALQRAVNAFKGQNQEELGRRLNAYQVTLFQEIQKALRWLASQETDRGITEADIPPQLKDRYIGQTGKILLEIYPKENVWDREPSERFVKELRSIDPQVTGTPVQNYEYLAVLKRSFEQAAWYALAVICIAIFLHFRSLKSLLLTLTPLGLGILWTLGLMGLINLRFNPANIITLPLVIGIGVAYGLYAVDRFKENPNKTLFDTSTGKAVWLSALTTIFGFGSLIQASYRGISSLGLLMTLGVGMCLITSLYVLPAFLKFFSKKNPNLS
ncbi:MAG: MMPL family transporter [Verrucomicrobiia bacterium]